jgi:hypothetical protein
VQHYHTVYIFLLDSLQGIQHKQQLAMLAHASYTGTHMVCCLMCGGSTR